MNFPKNGRFWLTPTLTFLLLLVAIGIPPFNVSRTMNAMSSTVRFWKPILNASRSIFAPGTCRKS